VLGEKIDVSGKKLWKKKRRVGFGRDFSLRAGRYEKARGWRDLRHRFTCRAVAASSILRFPLSRSVRAELIFAPTEQGAAYGQ